MRVHVDTWEREGLTGRRLGPQTHAFTSLMRQAGDRTMRNLTTLTAALLLGAAPILGSDQTRNLSSDPACDA